MKMVYRLERIGDDSIEAARSFDRAFSNHRSSGAEYGAPAVWQLRPDGVTGPEMIFRKDYSRANSCGSRGIYAEYYLEVGHCYRVRKRVSWKSSDTFYIRAKADGAQRITEKEALLWAKEHWDSMS
jgi:hypothetical protein